MLSRLRSLWRNLIQRDRVDRDLDNEVRAVFDILVDEKVRAGLSLEQARRAATIELGREAAITQQESEYLAALDTVRTFGIDANGLTLFRGDGGIAVTMTRP